MRILITGSRTWDNPDLIEERLLTHTLGFQNITLVSGACPVGADRMCEVVARRFGWLVEQHPADWNTYGKRAGFVRNSEMVNLGADTCAAFIKEQSRGATMTADLAIKANIPTYIYTPDWILN